MIGELFLAVVRDLASDGRGIVPHPAGLSLFVSGVWPGEEGIFEITERKAKTGAAKLIELKSPSPHRVNAPCPYHGHDEDSCGGCAWQFIDYSAQAAAKQQRVEKEFSRIGGIHRILSILQSERQLGYRNRAQFKTDGERIGFLAAQSDSLTAVEDCLVLTDKNRQTLSELHGMLPQESWRPNLPSKNAQSKFAKRKTPPKKKVKRREWTTLDIDESISSIDVSVNKRLAFNQANDDQNRVLRSWLEKKLSKLDHQGKVLELFSGAGNLTEVICQFPFESITAADCEGDAIASLDRRALRGVNTAAIDLYSEAQFERLILQNAAEILVLDPPRDGLRVKNGLFDKGSKLHDVFYISCSLATLIRDLQVFIENGFKIREVQPLDMFPQTPHIELMVHLRRRNG